LPFCSADRKKRKQINAFLHWDTGFNCNHCGEKGQLHSNVKIIQNNMQNRFKHDKTDYSDKFINYVTNIRSIEIKALKALKVRVKEWMPQTKDENCICLITETALA
jgi:hypothetical protein